MRTHYQNLQVDEGADPAIIKASYKVLAQRHHPDRNPENIKEAERIFRIITTAYEVLSDPVKRREYDEHLKDARYKALRDAAPAPAASKPSAPQQARRPTATSSPVNSWLAKKLTSAINKVVANPHTPEVLRYLLTPPWRLVLLLQLVGMVYLFRKVLF